MIVGPLYVGAVVVRTETPDGIARLRPTMRVGQKVIVDLATRRRMDLADPHSGEVLATVEVVDDATSGYSLPWECVEVRI